MTKLMKITLISALLATGAMAADVANKIIGGMDWPTGTFPTIGKDHFCDTGLSRRRYGNYCVG